MTSDENLPTREEMFARALADLDRAYAALGDAADWLRSDWRPLGSGLSGVQSHSRSEMFEDIGDAKRLINQAKDAAYRAMEGGR